MTWPFLPLTHFPPAEGAPQSPPLLPLGTSPFFLLRRPAWCVLLVQESAFELMAAQLWQQASVPGHCSPGHCSLAVAPRPPAPPAHGLGPACTPHGPCSWGLSHTLLASPGPRVTQIPRPGTERCPLPPCESPGGLVPTLWAHSAHPLYCTISAWGRLGGSLTQPGPTHLVPQAPPPYWVPAWWAHGPVEATRPQRAEGPFPG